MDERKNYIYYRNEGELICPTSQNALTTNAPPVTSATAIPVSIVGTGKRIHRSLLARASGNVNITGRPSEIKTMSVLR